MTNRLSLSSDDGSARPGLSLPHGALIGDIIQVSTIRKSRLTIITGEPANRRQLWHEEWIPTSDKLCLVWSPTELHRFLKGEANGD